jgi:response regulator of citrate/malate metabolism
MISVLIVEDEPVAAEALADYVRRVAGFSVVGVVRTGAEALRRLALEPCDLVLLDVYLPDMHGVDLLRSMRGGGYISDVIVMTRARDVTVLHAAAAYGIIHYLVKPFTFRAMRETLERYRAYHGRLEIGQPLDTQAEVDRILNGVHGTHGAEPPKGMARESLDAVVAIVRGATDGPGLSATEVAEMLGASRVTARRYLEYLTELGLVLRRTRYGGAHRPQIEYLWRARKQADTP